MVSRACAMFAARRTGETKVARALGSFVLVVLASAAACGPPQRESAVLVALVPPPVAPVHVPTTVPLVAERVAPEPELAPTDVASGSGEVNAHAPLIGPILTATKGTVLVFHVWASWCYPCKRAMPELESLYVKYKTKRRLGLRDPRATGCVASSAARGRRRSCTRAPFSVRMHRTATDRDSRQRRKSPPTFA